MDADTYAIKREIDRFRSATASEKELSLKYKFEIKKLKKDIEEFLEKKQLRKQEFLNQIMPITDSMLNVTRKTFESSVMESVAALPGFSENIQDPTLLAAFKESYLRDLNDYIRMKGGHFEQQGVNNYSESNYSDPANFTFKKKSQQFPSFTASNQLSEQIAHSSVVQNLRDEHINRGVMGIIQEEQSFETGNSNTRHIQKEEELYRAQVFNGQENPSKLGIHDIDNFNNFPIRRWNESDDNSSVEHEINNEQLDQNPTFGKNKSRAFRISANRGSGRLRSSDNMLKSSRSSTNGSSSNSFLNGDATPIDTGTDFGRNYNPKFNDTSAMNLGKQTENWGPRTNTVGGTRNFVRPPLQTPPKPPNTQKMIDRFDEFFKEQKIDSESSNLKNIYSELQSMRNEREREISHALTNSIEEENIELSVGTKNIEQLFKTRSQLSKTTKSKRYEDRNE